MREPEPEPVYEEEANWDDAQDVEYEEIPVSNVPVDTRKVEYAVQDEESPKDPWEDDENPKPYRAPQVNIPERKRVVEYEEETDY